MDFFLGKQVKSMNKNTQLLFKAIRQGRLEKVKILLMKDTNIEARLPNGYTPLLHAIRFKQEEIVTFLLGSDAYIEARENREYTALLLAVEKNMLSMVQLLLEHGADANARKYCYDGHDECDPRHWSDSALIIAAKKNNYPIVKLLLEHGADVNLCEECEAGAALHYTSDPQIVRLLIAYGADLEAVAGWLGTPLMSAACCHNYEKAKILLEHGVDIYAVNGGEGTAAHVAANSGCFSVLKLLLDAQYDPHYEVSRTLSLLWHGSLGISDKDIHKLFKLLLTYEYNVNKKYRGTQDFMKLLHWLPLTVAKEIIALGADIYAVDDYGKTAFGYIANHSRVKNVKYLFSLGIKMSKADEKSLFFCVEHDQLELLQVFIENGANIHALNAEGCSLVQYAKKLEHEEIYTYLEELKILKG